MNRRTRKESLLYAVGASFAMSQRELRSTACVFIDVLANTKMTLNKVKVFFEAEKEYTVNFMDQSPRTASQENSVNSTKTWADFLSNSSERISRNLRGFDLLNALKKARSVYFLMIEILYITPYSIYNNKINNFELQPIRLYASKTH